MFCEEELLSAYELADQIAILIWSILFAIVILADIRAVIWPRMG
ncbi:hypothetical protein V7127_03900 [Bacillus sp. JJ1773]